jgi:PHD/YefM family antitoxin component YafN of YafNO toxin-antitoxin module
MKQGRWQFSAAKAELSKVVDAALQGHPQYIAGEGDGAVIVLSESAYLALLNKAKEQSPGFISHLLAIPKRRSGKKLAANRRLGLREI